MREKSSSEGLRILWCCRWGMWFALQVRHRHLTKAARSKAPSLPTNVLRRFSQSRVRYEAVPPCVCGWADDGAAEVLLMGGETSADRWKSLEAGEPGN